MEHLPEELSIEELFEYQRKLSGSRNLIERLKTLWIGEQLVTCCP